MNDINMDEGGAMGKFGEWAGKLKNLSMDELKMIAQKAGANIKAGAEASKEEVIAALSSVAPDRLKRAYEEVVGK